jgi:hypothetical protein
MNFRGYYLDVKDSEASNASWSTQFSVDSGNNTGWAFLADPVPTFFALHCSIKDSNATNATWLAPTNYGNTDAGNNLGWNFGSFTERKDFSPFFALPITF